MESQLQKLVQGGDMPGQVVIVPAAERQNNDLYRYNGFIPGRKDVRTRNKGIAAKLRLLKRLQAEDRNRQTPMTSRAIFRRQSLEIQQQWMENELSTSGKV